MLTTKKNASLPPSVLVVEDEFFSRCHAVELVEAAGYRAVEASNADEAIAILEARKDICVVFTDINMPGSMDGLKLTRAIRDRWPPIELILPLVISMCRRATFPSAVYFFPSHIVTKK
jgi:CheY-like chemotaxis protein